MERGGRKMRMRETRKKGGEGREKEEEEWEKTDYWTIELKDIHYCRTAQNN
jgi:hypothetical protein